MVGSLNNCSSKTAALVIWYCKTFCSKVTYRGSVKHWSKPSPKRLNAASVDAKTVHVPKGVGVKGPATPPATTRPYQDGVSLFRKRVKETLQGLGYGCH